MLKEETQIVFLIILFLMTFEDDAGQACGLVCNILNYYQHFDSLSFRTGILNVISAAKYPKDNHLLLKHFHLSHSQTAPCHLYQGEGIECILNS